MSEEKQADSVKQNTPEANSSQDSQSAASSLAQPPEHLGLDVMAARGYMKYVDRLKLGKIKSTIGDFGSALELLCDSSEPERPPRLDVSGLQPGDDQDFHWRASYLAHLHRINTREFLSGYMAAAKAGEFGVRGKQSMAKLAHEIFSDVVKEFTCAGLYMTAIEQFERASSPEWLEQFFGASLRAVDQLVYGIPVINMIERLYSNSIAEMSIKVAEDLCGFLGFGGIGDPCWSMAYSFLRDSGDVRQRLLNRALIQQLTAIRSELSGYAV